MDSDIPHATLDQEIDRLRRLFDAVVMLTWSDWKTEPRSNRYHYATRFARAVPVFFVQPDQPVGENVVEASGIENIHLVHLGADYVPAQSELLDAVLTRYGIRRPLLWVYNVNFEQLVARRSNNCVVYHATEAYFVDPGIVLSTPDAIRPPLIRTLQLTDLLVSASDDVHRSYLDESGFSGRSIVLRNGCDFAFWATTGASKFVAPPDNRPIALYQGGINRRLDYGLISGLVDRMPDWDFWFCGRVQNSPGWEDVKSRTNVRYLGVLTVSEIAEAARQATVGIMPFLKLPIIHVSLPLKSYEYLACGLPVVTVPINALASYPDLFEVAHSVEEFDAAMRRVAPSRSEHGAVTRRLKAAAAESYDHRFSALVDELTRIWRPSARGSERMNLLVLYDHNSTHVSTIREHLEAFAKHSRHRVFYLPCTGSISSSGRLVPDEWDLSLFDAIVVHYCVRLSVDDHLNREIAEELRSFAGVKILFIQDEYDTTDTARWWMERIGFDLVFTCVPSQWVSYVYPPARFPKTRFLPTLTGFVPESVHFDAFLRSVADRHIRIAYRGRNLPYQYGNLAREKYQIGVDVKRLAIEHNVPVDIEVANEARIYGDDWYRFLASARATLGTESGSNIFDHDGELAKLAQRFAHLPYEKVYAEHLAPHEGPVRMNQISPKIFEAIALRTALVLFEGEYSGVIEPHKHYIPLKKDYSNIREIFAQLEDVPFLEALTMRAYNDVIASEKYSYRAFVGEFDRTLDPYFLKPARATMVSAPVVVLRRGKADPNAFTPHTGPLAFLLADRVLTARERAQIVAATPSFENILATSDYQTVPLSFAEDRGISFRVAKGIWRAVPWPIRRHVVPVAHVIIRWLGRR